MFLRIFNWCWITVTALVFMTTPLWAAEEGGDDTQVWVLPYAIVILFLALTLLILLRPTKRSDSAFSFDELQAQREAEVKNARGGH
jgi:type VI protein secretion system component VasK